MYALPVVIATQLAGVARGQESDVPDLALVAEQVVTAITDGEYAQARQQVDVAVRQLDQLEQPPVPQDLATLWQSLGAIGVYDPEQSALTSASFHQACAVLPGWFNERLGGMARQQWEAACAESQATASLEIASVLDRSAIYIDGQQSEERRFELAPGTHLVQVLTEGETPFQAVLSLVEAQHATLDAGLVAPQPAGTVRHLSLGAGTGLALAGAALLGWLALDAHGSWQQAGDTCSQTYGGCSQASIDQIGALGGRRSGLGVAAASCGLFAVGLGVTLAITW